ncbi:hypothetical protein X757_31785 [Mesorhizobium sp. LSHC414A00]|nr:hypothetical protein X757_31785 [Mesorhizobium sp. LSHC414A00]
MSAYGAAIWDRLAERGHGQIEAGATCTVSNIGHLAGVEGLGELLGKVALAASIMGQRQQLDHDLAGLPFRQPRDACHVDEIEKRHRLFAQGMDHVPIIDDLIVPPIGMSSASGQRHQLCSSDKDLEAIVEQPDAKPMSDRDDGSAMPASRRQAKRGPYIFGHARAVRDAAPSVPQKVIATNTRPGFTRNVALPGPDTGSRSRPYHNRDSIRAASRLSQNIRRTLEAIGNVCDLFSRTECRNYLKIAGFASASSSEALSCGVSGTRCLGPAAPICQVASVDARRDVRAVADHVPFGRQTRFLRK